MRLVNVETGDMRPVPCGRLKCPPCAAYLAWKRALAFAWVRPERRFDLTLVGDTWDEVRPRMKRYRYDIAQAGYSLEWAWMVEPNPAGTGHHVHGYQRGDFIPQGDLSAMAQRRGMGSVTYIKRLPAGSATGYGMKALTYGLKGHTRADSHALHLEVNGGRLAHHSRGFFGMPVKEAERRAVQDRRGGPSAWTIATVSELHRMFGKAPRP